MKTRLLGMLGALALISACGSIQSPAPSEGFQMAKVKQPSQPVDFEVGS